MKIFCIGRNYADHAKEMNSKVPDQPMVFMKPPTALVKNNEAVYYPSFTENLHYECELVVKIGKNGKSIDEKFALDYVSEISVGIDFTARDVQAKCKEKGHPWELAKAFDQSAPIGLFKPASIVSDWDNINFHLDINGERKQTGNTKDLIFTVPHLIHYISQFFTFQTGDLIYTGTPVGVGPVKIGDQLVASLEGEEMLSFEVK